MVAALLLLGSVGLTISLLCMGLGMQLKLSAGTPGVTASSIGVFVSLLAYSACSTLRDSLHISICTSAHGLRLLSTCVANGFACVTVAFHALSYGPISWLVATEILPQNIRGKAMGLATMANRVTSFIVASTFLTLCEKLHWSGAFYMYAGLAFISLVFYVLFVPETNGMALEAITPLFGKPRQLVNQNLRTLRHGGRQVPSISSAK